MAYNKLQELKQKLFQPYDQLQGLSWIITQIYGCISRTYTGNLIVELKRMKNSCRSFQYKNINICVIINYQVTMLKHEAPWTGRSRPQEERAPQSASMYHTSNYVGLQVVASEKFSISNYGLRSSLGSRAWDGTFWLCSEPKDYT